MPTVGPEIAEVHGCRKIVKVWYTPESGGRLCFAARGVDLEVEAQNAETLSNRVGWIVPMIPVSSERSGPRPLAIDLAFTTTQPYFFSPWTAIVTTTQGDTIGVARVFTNIVRDKGVHTVEVLRHDDEAHRLHEDGSPDHTTRYFLKFEKPVPPAQVFYLTLHLVGADGGDLPLPTITFREGKVSYFGTVP